MSLSLQQFGLDWLSSVDRIEVMGLIWDSLDHDSFCPPAKHLEILEERANDTQGSELGNLIPLEKVKNRLLKP